MREVKVGKIVTLWLYEAFAMISEAGECGKREGEMGVTESEKVNKMRGKDIR